MSARVSAYYLSEQGRATLRAEGLRIRAELAAKRAQRELQRIVHGPLERFEPLPVGDAVESDWGALAEAIKADPLRRHFEDREGEA